MIQEGIRMRECPLSFKIILLGDSSNHAIMRDIGKTCFIQQFIGNQFPTQTQPTITVDFISKKYQIDDFSVRLNIFDTAGQEKFRALTKAYFKGTDAVLFMYAMDNKESFENVLGWVNYFQKQCESKDQIRVLVGTKKDLLQGKKHEQGSNWEISKEEVKQFVERHHFTFKFETSAKSNLNINIVFQQLSRNLIYNSIKHRKGTHLIGQSEWPNILKRDKEHLLKQSQKNSGCC